MGRLLGIAVRLASRAPMSELEAIEVSRREGVSGDFRGRPGRRQVTVLNAVDWSDACRELGRDLPWTARRANLLVEGVDFGPESVGRIIEIGDLQLEITGETDPCERMTEACPGLREALASDWRGGVCCRVLRDGTVRKNDPVRLRPPEGTNAG